MGCMALIRNQQYTDFIMSVDIDAADNDGIGFVFGYHGLTDRYQVHMINDRWPDPAADAVPGGHMKFKKRNGKVCADTMDAQSTCFDLLAYVASDELRKDPHVYPNNKLTSMTYIPEPYSPTYHNYDQKITLTLLVKDKQARAYMTAADGARVGLWTDLLPTYTGGSVQCRNQIDFYPSLDFIFYFLTVCVVRSRSCDHSCRDKKKFVKICNFFWFYFIF